MLLKILLRYRDRRKFIIGMLSICRSIYVNFRHLPFSQARHIPIFVRFNAVVSIEGKMFIKSSIKRGMIHIGLNENPICNNYESTKLIVDRGGVISFNRINYFGCGCKIHVGPHGTLSFGENVVITANTSIDCENKIEIGNKFLCSWDVLIMDNDRHKIFDDEGGLINENRPICISDNVWVGCRSLILKGVRIPSNTVIASYSLVTGHNYNKNAVIGGFPAKELKRIGYWRM